MKIEPGQVAFVTGGASGIGLAIAQALGARGVAVMLTDIDPQQMTRAAAEFPGRCETFTMDVRNRDDWEAAKQACEQRLGPVDIVVNNAGIGPDGRSLAEMPASHFDQVIAINLTGVFNGIHSFAAAMQARGRGHIVNTASMAGLTAGPNLGAYTAAKFGVVGMSEVLQKELAASGVGVSVLCPGLVATRLGETSTALGVDRKTGNLAGTASGIDPAMVGERTVAAIEANDLYILTHGEYAPMVAKRSQRLAEAWAKTPVSGLNRDPSEVYEAKK